VIYFNFNLRNPFWADRFDNMFCWAKETVFKNKWIEFEVIKNDNLLRLEVEFTTRQDHAGANLELGLFGYEVHFKFYDCRHWDYEKNCWVVYSGWE
jgi:hypothetical protein